MGNYKIIALYAAIVIALFAVGLGTFHIDWKVCRVCGVQRYDRYTFGMQMSGYDEGAVEAKGPWEDGFFDPDGRARAYIALHGQHEHDWDVKRASLLRHDPAFEPRRTVLPHPPAAEIQAYLLAHPEILDPSAAATADTTPPAPAPAAAP